jgi:hypothetical protein
MSYTQVVDGIFRGPRPVTLADLPPGTKTVLSLESGFFEVFHDELYAEDIQDEAASVNIFHVPINSIGFPPSKKTLDATYNLIVNFGLHPIYVHCKQGVDRTGLAIAYFRIKQGMPIDQAIQEMKDLGFHMWSYWWWIPIFKSYL